jgi:hypothetical protein
MLWALPFLTKSVFLEIQRYIGRIGFGHKVAEFRAIGAKFSPIFLLRRKYFENHSIGPFVLYGFVFRVLLMISALGADFINSLQP